MAAKRIASGLLTLLLTALLAWSLIAGVADLRTRIFLTIGIVLGLLYTRHGRVPDGIVNYSGGSITDDNGPSNIPPRIYLPVLFGVVFLAVLAIALVVFAL